MLATLSTLEFQHEVRFDDSCLHGEYCNKYLEIKEDFKGPFYIYIKYENYYINHRKMAKSFDAIQLTGEDRSKKEVKQFCDVLSTNEQGLKNHSYAGTPLVASEVMNPCG